MSESDRYSLTRYKWTELYQEIKDAVAKFGSNTVVQFVSERDT